MPISSLIISINSEHVEDIIERVQSVPYVEVSDVREGSLVIITDTPDSGKDQETWDALVAITGVLSTDIIYHNFEDTELESHAEHHA